MHSLEGRSHSVIHLIGLVTMMGSIGACADMSRKIKGLLVDGAKFTASDDLEKAVQCYATVLDLESQRPEPYVLLAKCLYRIGLKNNDMFGGGDAGEDEQSTSEEDEEDDEEVDEAEAGQNAEQTLNSRLYQFDHEEEDVVGGVVQIRIDEEEVDADEGPSEEELEEAISPEDGFGNYLEGDVFENAMELLYRARIMYMESSKPIEQLPVKAQSRLVEIYELLGDIDQELEDFSQAVTDYEEAIRLGKEASSDESSEMVFGTYMKLAEALRWLDPDNYEGMTRDQHEQHLRQISALLKDRLDSGKSSDVEEDEARLERTKEDLQTLKEGKPATAVFDKQLMMQAILKQALESSQQGKVNDLSKMVKKNKKKKALKR